MGKINFRVNKKISITSCCFIDSKFQGLGLLFSTRNAICLNDYWLLDFCFLWLHIWVTIDFER